MPGGGQCFRSDKYRYGAVKCQKDSGSDSGASGGEYRWVFPVRLGQILFRPDVPCADTATYFPNDIVLFCQF